MLPIRNWDQMGKASVILVEAFWRDCGIAILIHFLSAIFNPLVAFVRHRSRHRNVKSFLTGKLSCSNAVVPAHQCGVRPGLFGNGIHDSSNKRHQSSPLLQLVDHPLNIHLLARRGLRPQLLQRSFILRSESFLAGLVG